MIVVGGRRGRPAVSWRGGRVLVKVRAADTEGRFSQIEIDDPRGWATPVHIHHREDETLFVHGGRFAIFVGDERRELGAGDLVFLPRGVPHAYLVMSKRGRALATFSPGGWEEYFVENGAAELGAGGGEPLGADDVEALNRAAALRGVEVVAPPPSLELAHPRQEVRGS